MKLFALAALVLVVSYLPRLFASLPPAKRKEVGRTVLAVVAASGVVVVFRSVGVILVTLGVLAYYLGSNGAAQEFKLWLFGAGHQKTPRRGTSGTSQRKGEMTRAEALEVLGLKEGTSREEILAQYRVLMKKVHPDVPGGSEYLATQVNMARDVLLD